MKTSIKLTMTAIMLIGSLSSFAQAQGAGGGNGGGVHYCEARSEQEFYDIYEGGKRYLLKFSESDARTRAQVLEDAIAKINTVNPDFASRVKKQLDYILDGNLLLDKDLDLPVVNDANILLKNKVVLISNWPIGMMSQIKFLWMNLFFILCQIFIRQHSYYMKQFTR